MTTNINAIDTHKAEVEWLEEHLKEAVELLENIATHTCMADSDMRTQLKEVYGWVSDFLDEFNGKTEDYSEYVGKLGWFWDELSERQKFIDVLKRIDEKDSFKYLAKEEGCHYQFFSPLTADEVEDYTTFKVIQED
jgi:hypothetical protein